MENKSKLILMHTFKYNIIVNKLTLTKRDYQCINFILKCSCKIVSGIG